MSEETTQQTSPKQNIILDTCVLGYMGDKTLNPEIINFLGELTKRGFELAISEITCFELLSESSLTKETEGLSILALFKRYEVDLDVIFSAAKLSSAYKIQANAEHKQLPIIETPDKIIAATSLLSGSLILTANVNDFPRPIFLEAEEKQILFKDKGKTKMLILLVLRPNYPLIQQRIEERK